MRSLFLACVVSVCMIIGNSTASAQTVVGVYENINMWVSVSPSGEVWSFLRQSGSYWSPVRFDGHAWNVVTDEKGNAPKFMFAMTPYVFDAAGNVLAGFDGGVAKFDGRNWTIYNESPTGNAYSLAIAPNGDLWYGSDYAMIFRMHDGVWTQFKMDEVFNWVQSIAVTSDGTVWAGLTGADCYRFDGASWSKRGPQGGHSMIVDRDGVLWAAVNGGIARFDGTAWVTNQPADPPENMWIQSLAAGWDDAIWVATSAGAYRFRDGEWTHYTTDNGLPSNTVRHIAASSNGQVWFATDKGLVLMDTRATSVEEKQTAPISFSIRGNAPNPFNPSTTISFSLPSPGRAELSVYSITGQKIRALLSGPMTAGTHSAVWDGRDDAGEMVSSGVYLTQLRSGKQVSSGKMLLMK